MISIALRLAVIAFLVYAGVTFWYGRMEERLQGQGPPPAAQQENGAPPVREGEEPTPAAADHGIIVTRNIFQAGSASADRRGAFFQTEEEGLEETTLHLALLGTVTGSADDARAIIRDEKTKLEDLYRTGSEIQGARINRISRGKVVLLVSGREEVLIIKDPAGDDQGRGAEPRVDARRTEMAPESPAGAIENKVPEAQPRRRISFRNTPAPLPAAEQPAPPVPEEAQPEAPDGQPPAPDEGVPAGTEKETPPEAPLQGQ